MEPVMQSATLGRAWQLQMDEALLEFGLNWGYGGTTMANWLQSTEVYSATKFVPHVPGHSPLYSARPSFCNVT
jgi:hypothetical protein